MQSQLSFISVADVLSLVFFLGIALLLSKRVRGGKRLFSLLTLLHFAMTLFYYFYSLRFPEGSDSTLYYLITLEFQGDWIDILDLRFATSSIYFICSLLVHPVSYTHLTLPTICSV